LLQCRKKDLTERSRAMAKRSQAMPEADVVELLMRQHEQIRGLLQEVEEKKGDRRAAAFERLRRLLAVHEMRCSPSSTRRFLRTRDVVRKAMGGDHG
jgi:hypothetical protein